MGYTDCLLHITRLTNSRCGREAAAHSHADLMTRGRWNATGELGWFGVLSVRDQLAFAVKDQWHLVSGLVGLGVSIAVALLCFGRVKAATSSR